jgi:hypothetical protein
MKIAEATFVVEVKSGALKASLLRAVSPGWKPGASTERGASVDLRPVWLQKNAR